MLHRLDASHPTLAERDTGRRLTKALELTARRLDAFAAMPNQPAYHNRAHNIFVMAVRLVRGQSLLSHQRSVTAADHVAELRDLTAALGHDLGHDGTSNNLGGTYRPLRLERLSTDYLVPLLSEAGVEREDQDHIRLSVWATDPVLSGEMLYHAARTHFASPLFALPHEKIVAQIDTHPAETRSFLTELFTALERNPALTASALALKSADMVSGYGLGESTSLKIAYDLEAELKIKLVDNGKCLAEPDLFVMMNFVGTCLCDNGQTARPCFPDPESQRLFGRPLDHQFAAHIASQPTPIEPTSLLLFPREAPHAAPA